MGRGGALRALSSLQFLVARHIFLGGHSVDRDVGIASLETIILDGSVVFSLVEGPAFLNGHET